MKILEKSQKFTKIPAIVQALDPTETEFKEMISRFPLRIVRALKEIFVNGDPIAIAAKENNTSVQLIRYYIKKMQTGKDNAGKLN